MQLLIVVATCFLSSVIWSSNSQEEKETTQFQEILSQELLDAAAVHRAFDPKLISRWRQRYTDFMDDPKNRINRETVGYFLAPYFYKLRSAFVDENLELGERNHDPQKFRFRYEICIENQFCHEVERELVITNQTESFTLGRGHFNLLDMTLPNPDKLDKIAECDRTLSRMHLEFIPLANGQVMFFDAFSIEGIEVCGPDALDPPTFMKIYKNAERTYEPLYLPSEPGGKLFLRVARGLLTVENLGSGS